MDVLPGVPDTVIVVAAVIVVWIALAFLTRWFLRIDQIVWLLTRAAGLPEVVARRRTLKGMIREARLHASVEVPAGLRPEAPSSVRPAAAAAAAKPSGPQTAGREIAFQDRIQDAEGRDYRVVGSVSSGLLVETPTGARDVIMPINPDEARKDWIYPVGRIGQPS